MDIKPFYKSKKLWTGIIILISSIGAVATGDRAFDTNMIAELVAGVFGIVQTILAIKEGNPIAFGKVVLGNKD